MKLVAILASLFALALSESNDCEALGCNYYPKDGVSKLINCKEDGSRVSVIFYGDNNCNWSGFVDIDISPNNICCSQVSEPESETPTLPIGRIVGGQSVTYDKYPFMALLNGGSCGGSILRKSSPAMILTAAHCYQAFTGTVKLGADSLNDNTNVVTSAIKSFIIHPDYGFDLNHDIAILWLEKDISSQTQFKQILPITKVLAGSECCNDGADLQVIGYGDDLNFQPTPTLEYVDVDYVKRSTCNTAYSGGITNNMICAASPGKDSCLGDSGGPLIKKGTLQQVGIVSWGESCAHPTKPGVYVELGRYLEWINLYQQQNIPPQVISAEVSMVCDNDGEYSVSQDGGKTFKSSPYIYSNPIPDNGGNDLWLDASFPVSKVSSNTVIKFKCTDTDNNGGFMATIRYKGKQFSTKQGSNYKLGDGSTTGITYKARSAAPWLDRLQANVGADAQFMWNGQNSNTMEFKFDFGSLSETSNSAEVIVSCDDIGTYYRSDNDGISYTQIIGKSNHWMLPISMIITSITDKTKLKFVCKDNGVIGGFIGTVRYKGKEYSTTNPINNGHFKLIGTNSGLIYNPKLTKPWTEVTSSFSGNKWVDNSKLISNDAYWIWDGNVGNTKEFTFDFGDIINL